MGIDELFRRFDEGDIGIQFGVCEQVFHTQFANHDKFIAFIVSKMENDVWASALASSFSKGYEVPSRIIDAAYAKYRTMDDDSPVRRALLRIALLNDDYRAAISKEFNEMHNGADIVLQSLSTAHDKRADDDVRQRCIQVLADSQSITTIVWAIYYLAAHGGKADVRDFCQGRGRLWGSTYQICQQYIEE